MEAFYIFIYLWIFLCFKVGVDKVAQTQGKFENLL